MPAARRRSPTRTSPASSWNCSRSASAITRRRTSARPPAPSPAGRSRRTPGSFKEAGHDGGEKTFLKQTGAWKSGDIVRITLEQPACAEFLCRKLYRFFVREDEDPGPELLRPLAEELRGNNYDVGHVVGVMLRSRHFYDPAVRRQRVKSPVEFSAGLLRTLEVPRADVRLLALALACERQGQDLFSPPNVKGWDGGKTWLNSTTVLERGNWCNDVIWGNADFGLKAVRPAGLGQARRRRAGEGGRGAGGAAAPRRRADRERGTLSSAPAARAAPTPCVRPCN